MIQDPGYKIYIQDMIEDTSWNDRGSMIQMLSPRYDTAYTCQNIRSKIYKELGLKLIIYPCWGFKSINPVLLNQEPTLCWIKQLEEKVGETGLLKKILQFFHSYHLILHYSKLGNIMKLDSWTVFLNCFNLHIRFIVVPFKHLSD